MADNIFACKTAYSNVIDLADNTDSYIKSGSLTIWQILLCLITGNYNFEPNPILVKNIFICAGVVF